MFIKPIGHKRTELGAAMEKIDSQCICRKGWNYM